MGYFSKLSEGTAGQPIPTAKETTAPAAPSDVRDSVPGAPAGTVPATQEPQIKAVSTSVPNAPSEPTAAQEGSQEGETAVAPIPLDVPADDAAARQAHDATEAKRKADWDAKQAEKQAAQQAALDKLAAMSDEDVIKASTKRVGDDVERLTRRSMKEQVAGHIQKPVPAGSHLRAAHHCTGTGYLRKPG